MKHTEDCLDANDDTSVLKGECICPKEPEQWFLVAASPGVDIRHKVQGQELILVKNVNYQIANKIVRAVNEHENLLSAAKTYQEINKRLRGSHEELLAAAEKIIDLVPHDVITNMGTMIERHDDKSRGRCELQKAIAKAEGK